MRTPGRRLLLRAGLGLLLHPDARLDAAERRLLVEALEAMGGGGRGGPGRD